MDFLSGASPPTLSQSARNGGAASAVGRHANWEGEALSHFGNREYSEGQNCVEIVDGGIRKEEI